DGPMSMSTSFTAERRSGTDVPRDTGILHETLEPVGERPDRGIPAQPAHERAERIVQSRTEQHLPDRARHVVAADLAADLEHLLVVVVQMRVADRHPRHLARVEARGPERRRL